MKQQVSIAGDVVTIALTGSVYEEESERLQMTLLEYMEQRYNRFNLLLHTVDYIDSAGLGMLVAMQKRALLAGGEIIIFGLQGAVKELFELSRLDKVFKLQE